MLTLIICVVILALVFDFINGFHDTANAIATVVSTGVLPLRTAIMVAAVLNFVGALTGPAVASTIGKGIITHDSITLVVTLSALVGAIFWNLFTSLINCFAIIFIINSCLRLITCLYKYHIYAGIPTLFLSYLLLRMVLHP
jgi:phosphate/sulfate permease